MYFLHEHPYSATSWKEESVKEVVGIPGVRVVRGDMCTSGMWQNTEEGRKLVMKPTGCMTNASEIAEELKCNCDGTHQHVKLLSGRARRAEVYPDEVCFKIMRGLMNQMKKDGRIQRGGIGAVMAEDETEDDWNEADDDVTGEQLDAEGVKQARRDEIEEIKKHRVYTKVPVKDCWDKTGKAPIKTRWLDINKGDKVHKDLRSRLVAKDFNKGKRPDLFAATPPLEALKLLIASWMTKAIGFDDNREGHVMDFIDIRGAYFHAMTKRDVYVELPEEDAEEGMCGKLMKSLYGTRDAAQNWETEYSDFMKRLRITYGMASPCTFYYEARGLRAVVQGDDFTMMGPRQSLNWLRTRIEDKFEIKFRGRLAERKEDMKSIRILNRLVTWTKEGIEYESGQRHAEIIIRHMGLKPDSKSVNTPGIRTRDEGEEQLKELGPKETSLYRGIVVRAKHLSQDRSDIKAAVKELSRRMAKARVKDVEAVKRLARYLACKPRTVIKLKSQKMPEWVEGWSDSDWAGCLETRKSTSGGVIRWGNHTLKAWSTTQSVITLSSGEADFYALVKAASQRLGMRVMIRDLGIKTGVNLETKVKVVTDASAARGMALRRGLGTVRHLELNQLWIQDKLVTGKFVLTR